MLISQTSKYAILDAVQVTLTPRGEQLLRDHLARNSGTTAEEILERALEHLAETQPRERKKTPAEAVAHIRESRKGVRLGALKIKDLIHEGHKY
jgi:hypothetical protein